MKLPPSLVFVAIAAVMTGYAILLASQQDLSLTTITAQLVAVVCMQAAQYFKDSE